MYKEKRWVRLVKRHKAKFSKTMMFGTPISELSPNELRACICVLGDKQKWSNKRLRDLKHEAPIKAKQRQFWSMPNWKGETS